MSPQRVNFHFTTVHSGCPRIVTELVIYIYTYIYIHIYTHIHIYIYTHIYIYSGYNGCVYKSKDWAFVSITNISNILSSMWSCKQMTECYFRGLWKDILLCTESPLKLWRSRDSRRQDLVGDPGQTNSAGKVAWKKTVLVRFQPL